VIQRLGGTTAVLTLMTIPTKDCSPGNRNCSPIGHPHVPGQSHDGGNLDRQGLGIPDLVLVYDNKRLLGQDEYERPSFADNGEGLITGVEDKGPGHSISLVYLAPNGNKGCEMPTGRRSGVNRNGSRARG